MSSSHDPVMRIFHCLFIGLKEFHSMERFCRLHYANIFQKSSTPITPIGLNFGKQYARYSLRLSDLPMLATEIFL